MTDQPPIADEPAKLDPETLTIRSRPKRAIRFKRGAIVAIAAMGSVSLVAVTWIALKPSVFQHVIAQEEQSPPAQSRPQSDALGGLPATYGDVPKLGPPLPGDLGKPILEHQQTLADENITGDAQRAEQAAAAARERRVTEVKSARESALLVQSHHLLAMMAPVQRSNRRACRVQPRRRRWRSIRTTTRIPRAIKPTLSARSIRVAT